MKNLGKKVLIATLFGVLVYAGLALWSDVAQLRRLLVTFEWWTFAGALALAFTNYVIRFGKWEFYLRRLGIGVHAPGEPFKRLPTGESFTIFLSGFALSITPGKAGEVFKSALLLSARGTPIAKSAPIVVADRLTDLLSLIVLVAIGGAAFPGYAWIAAIAGGMVAGVLFFVVFETVTLRMIATISGFKLGAGLAPKLEEAYRSLKVMTSPGALIAMTGLSVVAWGLECGALALILKGLGAPVRIEVAFFSYATATIAGAVAMLPGGLGGTEVTMRQMLTAIGRITPAAAGAATLLVRLATLWFAVIVGFVALAVFRRRYDRHVGAEAKAGSP
ncbi:MAG: lysylphosphatidylglycerol synthase transmembrane domain-containing protein [Deltaproteobacteria bacterium]